ncbi:hypothetical protein HK098_007756, partial [Nowakowskiella sp. JEL0407]
RFQCGKRHSNALVAKLEKYCKFHRTGSHSDKECNWHKKGKQNQPQQLSKPTPTPQKKRWCEYHRNDTHDTEFCKLPDDIKRRLKLSDAKIAASTPPTFAPTYAESTGFMAESVSSLTMTVDSGATEHMVNNRDFFTNYTPLNEGHWKI